MKYIKILSLIFISAFFITGCIDQAFDEPEFTATGNDPEIDEAKLRSMKDVKTLSGNGSIVEIVEDIYMKGIVVSDDKSGNIYKILYVQDEIGEGGIQIAIDATDLHATYQQFRRVFVSLKGLYVGKSNGAWAIGVKPDAGKVGRIPQALVENFLIPGMYHVPFTPKVLRLDELNLEDHGNTLVEIQGLEFKDALGGITFANPDGTNGENRQLLDCDGNSVILRNSDFADFAGEALPTGNGVFKGIFTTYNTTKQMVLNSTNDLAFTNERCNGTSAGVDPEIDASKIKSMAEVKAISGNGDVTIINDDIYVQGVVISSDQSGNFYKVLYLQDEKGEGGIQLPINSRDLYLSYPIGRRVFVKLSGLYIGKKKGSWSVGPKDEDGFIGSIQEDELNDYLLAGVFDVAVTPTVLSLDNLDKEKYGNTLITINNVEFAEAVLNKTYADAEEKKGVSHDIKDCDGNKIVLRTSGYADFAGDVVPSGNGTITGIYSIYIETDQVFINKVSDITFTGDRCDNSSSGNEQEIDIIELRNMFASGTTAVPQEKKIIGTVISDRVNGNGPHSQNLVIQDATGGIEVRFTEDHSYDLNDQLEIVVSGAELSEFNGTIQINNVSISAAKKKGQGSITPRTATIEELLNNSADWQSTLVEIVNVTIESGTFEGNKSIEDATGSMVLRTGSNAVFATESTPTGEVGIIGILSTYSGTDQLKMRMISDVTGGGSGGGEDIFKDDFESGIGAWTAFSVKGDQVWVEDTEHGNPGTCAKVTGYEGGAHENEDWLISPSVNLSSVSSAILKFETAKNYDGNDLELLMSTDYAGSGDPTSANWDMVTFTKSSGGWEWIGSGDIDLSSYTGGNVFIGFKFTSTDSASSTWELDNIVVK